MNEKKWEVKGERISEWGEERDIWAPNLMRREKWLWSSCEFSP